MIIARIKPDFPPGNLRLFTNGKILGKDGLKRLNQVIQKEKISISEIMSRAFSEYYERWSQKEDSAK